MSKGTTEVRMPEAFEPLFKPARYKAYYGGRGSAKSHSIAMALLILGSQSPIRVLCCREIQKSIKDSVKRLLDDKIKSLGLSAFYKSTESEIRGLNGTLFVFAGLRTNTDNIKSMEAIDYVWVEEAHTVSQKSLDILIPTIRSPNSEIWFSWNPDKKTDPVDKMFRGDNPPPNAIIRRVSWRDNPWFPKVLRVEMEHDKIHDPDRYAHVWEGEYVTISQSRVFNNWSVRNFLTPDGVRFYFGADWGFSIDPTVLIRCFIDEESRELFVDDEAYEIGCEIDETPALFAGNCPYPRNDKRHWPNSKRRPGIRGAHSWPIIADSSRPETISHMTARGFDIRKALKGPGSIEDGIEFLKSYNIVVHPRCTHTIQELTHYSWKIDDHTGEILPVLVDKNNHVIDALRYAVEARRRAKLKKPFDLALSGEKSSNWANLK